MLGPIQNQPVPVPNSPFDPQTPQNADRLQTYLMGLGDTLINGALNQTPPDVLAQNIVNDAPNELGFTLPQILGPVGHILKTVVTLYTEHMKKNSGNSEKAKQAVDQTVSESIKEQIPQDQAASVNYDFDKTWQCLKEKGVQILEALPDCGKEIIKKKPLGALKECAPIIVDGIICGVEGKQ